MEIIQWFSNNLSTILISLVLVIILGIIVYRLYLNKKRGKTSCGNNCAGCALQNTCHKVENSNTMNHYN